MHKPALVILLLILISFNYSCYHKTGGKMKETFEISYSYSAETAYFDFKIRGDSCFLTTLNQEKIAERCAQWVQQSPCWTSEDLISKKAEMPQNEIEKLKKLIEQERFLDTPEYTGPEKNERCYAYTIKLQYGDRQKTVVWCSRPQGPAEPESFKKMAHAMTMLAEGIFQ